MQATVRLNFPAAKFGFDQGRAAIAAALDGVPNVESIFGHAGEHFQRTRIHSFGTNITIDLMDQAAIDTLLPLLAKVMDFLQPQYGAGTLAFTLNNATAIEDREPQLYVAHSVVLGYGLKECDAFAALDAAGQRAYCQRVLHAGLLRQAEACGLLLTGELPEATNIQILKVHPRAPVIRKGDKIAKHAIVVNFAFLWSTKIAGSWQIGGLGARGHGRIWYATPSERATMSQQLGDLIRQVGMAYYTAAKQAEPVHA